MKMANTGVTFIHAMIFSSLLGILIFTSMQLTKQKLNLATMVQGDIALQRLHGQIHGILSKPEACEHSLRDITFTNPDPGPVDSILDLHNREMIRVGNFYGNGKKIQVQSMALTDRDLPANGKVKARLFVTYRKDQLNITKTIDIFSEDEDSIQTCQSINDPNGDDIKTTPCRALWYDVEKKGSPPYTKTASDCANVGIGTDNPQFRLDVNGNLNVTSEHKIYRKYQPLIDFGPDTNKHLTVVGPATGSSAWDRSLYMGIYNASNITGLYNVAIGVFALHNGAGGANNSGANTIIGSHAGYNNENKGNTLIGYNAGKFIQGTQQDANGAYNTCIGSNSCRDLKNRSYNVMIGSEAGAEVVQKQRNTFLGRRAGFKASGDDNVYIGNSAGEFMAQGSNNICIGAVYDTTKPCSNINSNNMANIGQAIFMDLVQQRVAIGAENFQGPSGSLHVKGSAWINGVGLNLSDENFKRDVMTLSHSEDLYQLAPVQYLLRAQKNNKRYYGFIAQEVEKILPELVTSDSQGYLSLNYLGTLAFVLEDIKKKKIENEKRREKLFELKQRIELIKEKLHAKN